MKVYLSRQFGNPASVRFGNGLRVVTRDRFGLALHKDQPVFGVHASKPLYGLGDMIDELKGRSSLFLVGAGPTPFFATEGSRFWNPEWERDGSVILVFPWSVTRVWGAGNAIRYVEGHSRWFRAYCGSNEQFETEDGKTISIAVGRDGFVSEETFTDRWAAELWLDNGRYGPSQYDEASIWEVTDEN